MGRQRTVPPVMDAPTHANGVKPCVVMTANAAYTMTLPEGSFTALVFDNDQGTRGAIAILDHDDVEALILMLRNSDEDARRLDEGKGTIHASPSSARH